MTVAGRLQATTFSSALAACALLLLAACRDEATPQGGAMAAGANGGAATNGDGEQVILVVDGLSFTRQQVEEFFPWLHSVHSRSGRNLLAQYVLGDYLIPVALARREFRALRDEQQQRAATLRKVIGNGGYPELVARGQAFGGFAPHPPVQSPRLALPLQRWAFDVENLGQVSPPLEVPEGFALIAAADVRTGVTRLEDTAEVFLVPFYTHTAAETKRWLDQRREAIADRVTWVHPEWRDALPPWLHLPAASGSAPPPADAQSPGNGAPGSAPPPGSTPPNAGANDTTAK